MKEAIIKQHGKGAVTQLSDKPIFDEKRVIRTGSLGLDIALGIGGYGRGRIIEVIGPESSGKTTLTLHAIASVQKDGGTCAFIDAEHSLDVVYAKKIGVDVDALLLSQPNYGEQALDIVEMMCRSGLISLIVVDSVAALTPKAEIEGEMGDQSVGAHARLMSKGMRKLVAIAAHTDTCIMFTNQIRSKIGVIYGSPEVTTGGNALKFYASQRLDIRRKAKIEDKIAGNNVITGNKTLVKVIKNKLAPPFREAEFDILYGVGIDQVSEILDFAVIDNLMLRAGAYYSLNDECGTKIAQGRANAVQYLKENPELVAKLRKSIFAKREMGQQETSKEGEKDEQNSEDGTAIIDIADTEE